MARLRREVLAPVASGRRPFLVVTLAFVVMTGIGVIDSILATPRLPPKPAVHACQVAVRDAEMRRQMEHQARLMDELPRAHRAGDAERVREALAAEPSENVATRDRLERRRAERLGRKDVDH